MSQERLSMRKIREVLRLHWECDLSNRSIGRSCSISHSTVSDYINRANLARLSWPLPEALDDDALFNTLFSAKASIPKTSSVLPDWTYIDAELKRKGVTRKLLWLEYRQNNPEGYEYSQFCQLFKEWKSKLDPSMRLTHKSGEKCFWDYAGQTVDVVDTDTGEIREAQVFVAVLGASSYTYAEAQWSQDLPSWINAHVNAMNFFGGATEIWVPDNLKSGVTKPCRYEPDINPTYNDLAKHYDVAVVPSRVKKPKDKAKVEVGVQVVERWILARLRNQQFFNLNSLNKTILTLLDELNNRKMVHLGKSRKELFTSLDKPALRPLPKQTYEIAEFKKAKVSVDHHISFDGNFYSAPYRIISQEVFVRATKNAVEIYHKSKRVASHRRMPSKHGKYCTDEAHRPPAHKSYLAWTPERFLRWANNIGPATAEIIQIRLNSKKHPEQSYRSCFGILGLSKRYSSERLDAACRRALLCGISYYKGIKNILDSRFDQLQLDETPQQPTASHTNVRGKTYYN